jgi:hypothetical protein
MEDTPCVVLITWARRMGYGKRVVAQMSTKLQGFGKVFGEFNVLELSKPSFGKRVIISCPQRSVLFKKHISDDPLCPICGLATETTYPYFTELFIS